MVTKSKLETQKIAAKLAKKILRATSYDLRAKIIALQGDLGAGKTTFVQGFIKALGIKKHITSPTFVIMRKYHLEKKRKAKSEKFSDVYHLDLYRIHKPKEILDLGFKKIISNSQNIVLIEWPEKVKNILSENTIWINFEHGRKKSERLLNINQ